MPTKMLTERILTERRGFFPRNTMSVCRTGVAVVLFTALFAGCSSEPFPLEKVSGKVVYEDGTPVKADSIQVIFKPQDVASVGEKSPRGAKGMADPSSGEFDSLSTWKTGDGVICGTHRVAVIPFRKQKRGMDLPDPRVVPKNYFKTGTTLLEVVVTRGGENHFELVVPKPAS